MSSKELRINEQIRVREVRLIDEEGKQLGVVPVAEALSRAQEAGTDLVEIDLLKYNKICNRLYHFL